MDNKDENKVKNNNEQVEEKEKQKQNTDLRDKLKELVEKEMGNIANGSLDVKNLEYLYKLTDIHKDLENEDYWDIKKEVLEAKMEDRYYDNVRYPGEYSRDSYSNYNDGYNGRGSYSRGYNDGGNYGRNYRDGGYNEGSYGRRGRGYRGESRFLDTLEDMKECYLDYVDSKDAMRRGSYGAKGVTVESLDYMLKSVEDFMKKLQQEANSQEEMELVKKYAKKISEM